jgi:hypothetical protein
MARRLSIPKDHQKTILKLFSLPADKRTVIFSAIDNLTSSSNLRQYAAILSSEMDLDLDEARRIIEVLVGIYSLVDVSDTNVETVVSDISDALRELDSPLINQASPEAFKDFETFVSRFLSMKTPLGVRAKAFRVRSQHGRIFLRSEIYSDIRTVFQTNDPNIRPDVAVLLHSLKLTCMEGRERRDFYVTMDHRDLQQLARTVDRALKKNATLSRMITDFGMECIDIEEDD